VIVLYPLLVVGAVLILGRARQVREGVTGWRWFGAAAAAGFVLALSLAAGLSIGLFLLPVAAILLFWVAGAAPEPPETLGFFTGVGVVALLVAALGSGGNRLAWAGAGLVLAAGPLAAYARSRRS
jgi:hypothetical protein